MPVGYQSIVVQNGRTGPHASQFDFVVFVVILICIFALTLAAAACRVRPLGKDQWWKELPVPFVRNKEDYTATGWSLVLAKRALLVLGMLWALIAFMRHPPG